MNFGVAELMKTIELKMGGPFPPHSRLSSKQLAEFHFVFQSTHEKINPLPLHPYLYP